MGYFEEQKKKQEAETPASFRGETEKEQITKITKFLGTGEVAQKEIKRIKKNRGRARRRAIEKARLEAERKAKLEAERKAKLEAERKAREKRQKIQLAKIEAFKTKKEQSREALIQLKQIKLSSPEQNLTNKVLTGQTITPQEKKNYDNLIKKKSNELSNEQITLLKNAPKDIGTGLYEVGKELVMIPVSAVKGSYNYGKTLRQRYEKGENHPLKNDIVKLGKGTVGVAKFVANNPKEAAAIVGLYSSAAGKEFSTAFSKNPVKTTTKAVAYLFPATILKGGAAVVKVGAKGVTSTVQAKRLTTISKSVTAAKQGALTTGQAKKLNNAVVGASKIGNKAKRETKVKNALKGILKERGVKPRRAATIEQLSKQVKASKVQPIKVLPKKVLPKKPRPKKVEVLEVKGKKVTKKKITAAEYEKLKAPKKVRGKRGKYLVVEGKKVTRVTKKEYTKLTKPVKKKPTKLDVKELAAKTKAKQERLLKKELAAKGVAKRNGVTYIDLNAATRVEKATTPVKPIARKTLLGSKKAQVRFSRQTQIQVQRQVHEVKKAKKVVKALKKKKASPKQISKAKADKVVLKSKLNKLKQIIKANKGIILRAPIILKAINVAIKDISAIDKAIGQIPKPAKKPKVTPKKKPVIKPAKKPAKKPKIVPKKAIKPAKKTPAKKKPVTKQVLKKIPKKPKAPKKPVKKPKKLKLKIKVPTGKKKPTKMGAITYTPTGKKKPVTIKTGLPINRAKKVARQGLDNSILGSVSVKPYGKTTAKDIKDSPSAKNRRKRSKKNKVQTIVEKSKFRLDSVGEKKGIKFSQAVKSAIKKEKAKLKTAPKKAKKTIKKVSKPKTVKKVKKVVKKAPKKVIKKVLRKPVKKKMSAATKKKISLALKKLAKKKKVKKIVKKSQKSIKKKKK